MAKTFWNPQTWFEKKKPLVIEHKTEKKTKPERKDDPARQQRETALGYSNINWLYGGFEELVNPDNLVRIKGARIYNKMLADDQVSAAFNLKLNLIISRGFRFEPTGPGQEKIIDFFTRNITDLISGTWLSALRSILMGKAYGFSVNEKIFRSEMVDNKPRWVLDRVKLKPYDSILFNSDKYGNRTGMSQTVEGDMSQATSLDPSKFIIYVNKPELDPLWGVSDLKSAYKPYWQKDITGRYWDIYIERVAGGFPVITPNERASNLVGNERTKLENSVKNVTGLSGLILPQGFEADLVQAEETQAFEKKIDKHDRQISRTLLMPNLLGLSEQGKVGSYAQSKTQFDILMMLLVEDGDYLADVVNEQLFSQLAYWNFQVKDYPKYTFEPFTEIQKQEIAKIWIEAAKGNVVTNMVEDEIRLRELIRFPIPEKEEIEEQKKQKQVLVPKAVSEDESKEKNNKKDDDSSQKDNKTTTPSETEAKQNNSEGVHVNVYAGSEQRDFSDRNIVQVRHEASNNATITYSDRIDFKTTEGQLDDAEDTFLDNITKNVDLALAEVTAAIRAIKKGLPKDKDKIDYTKVRAELNKSISTKTKSSLKRGIYNNLRNIYNLGWNLGYKATLKAAKDNDAPSKFINRINSVGLVSEQKMCEVEEWSIAHFVEGISLEAANAWFSSRSFTITGDLTSDMISSAVNIMTNGIMNDWSTAQMVNEFIDANINITGGTAKQERARLNTIVRTNMSTIFTQAQLAFYNDPDLRGFVEAMEYSAIIDRRTTKLCERLDRATYPMNDPIWRFITPPNHHQCRSVLIPVTILDKWKKDRGGFSAEQLPGKGFGRTGLAKMFDIKL